MQTKIEGNREAYNYKKLWQFMENYGRFRCQYPTNTLVFQVGAHYCAFGPEAQRIIENARAESGDPGLYPRALAEPLVIERAELYRHIGIMSETCFPIKIIYADHL